MIIEIILGVLVFICSMTVCVNALKSSQGTKRYLAVYICSLILIGFNVIFPVMYFIEKGKIEELEKQIKSPDKYEPIQEQLYRKIDGK